MNMGIDPNNHRLGQNLPRPQKDRHVSDGATSSDSKNEMRQLVNLKGDNDDHVSEAGSCLEDGPSGVPDLNLDLTITTNSRPLSNIVQKEPNDHTKSKILRELERAPSPTLILFH